MFKKLVLTNVPNAKSWNGYYHDAVQAYADEHGIEYIDLNKKLDEMDFDWSTDSAMGGRAFECERRH